MGKKFHASPTEDISLLYLILMAMEFAAIMERATSKFCFQVKLLGKVVILANLKHSRSMLDHQDQRMHQLLHLLVLKRMRLVLRVINAAVVDAGLTNATSYYKNYFDLIHFLFYLYLVLLILEQKEKRKQKNLYNQKLLYNIHVLAIT